MSEFRSYTTIVLVTKLFKIKSYSLIQFYRSNGANQLINYSFLSKSRTRFIWPGYRTYDQLNKTYKEQVEVESNGVPRSCATEFHINVLTLALLILNNVLRLQCQQRPPAPKICNTGSSRRFVFVLGHLQVCQ